MAKVNNVGPAFGQRVINPFKTSRTNATNPFTNYQAFEGNTLPYADVFEGFQPKNNSKMKMIAASVAGSMTKLRSSITEPIIKFANRIKETVVNAWDYAINKDITELKGIKALNEVMHTDISDLSKSLGNSLSGLGSNMNDKIDFLNTDILDLSKGLSEKWNALINKISNKKITKDTTVDELKAMWKQEIALTESEAA